MGVQILTPEMEEIILEKLAEGSALNAICGTDEIPVAESTVRKRAVEDQEFGARYARARSVGYDCRAERAVENAKEEAKHDANAARLAFDAERWYLGKMKPQTYGDKIDLTSGGEKIAPPTSSLAIQVAALLHSVQERAQIEQQENDDGEG
jgi:hypothetical protein